jgi:hypothetical protein
LLRIPAGQGSLGRPVELLTWRKSRSAPLRAGRRSLSCRMDLTRI